MRNYKEFFAPLGYITIMAVGMVIMHYGFGYTYGEPAMMKVLVFVEIALTLYAIFCVKKFSTWRESGFEKLDIRGSFWLLPSFVLMAFFIAYSIWNFTGSITPEQYRLIAITGATTLMVGFSEELMFRGIVLNWCLKKYNVIVAILVSSVAFSLLHSINWFGGENLADLKAQMYSTFLFGLFAALVALKIKNIIPLMIFHFLWDFVLITSTTLNSPPNISLSLIVWYQYAAIGLLGFFVLRDLWVGQRFK